MTSPEQNQRMNSVYFREQFRDKGEGGGFGGNSWANLIRMLLVPPVPRIVNSEGYSQDLGGEEEFHFIAKGKNFTPDTTVKIRRDDIGFKLLIKSSGFGNSIEQIKRRFSASNSKSQKKLYLDIYVSTEEAGFFEVRVKVNNHERPEFVANTKRRRYN